MRSSWVEPYLWVHLAGVAAVPIFLELCLVGLAASQAVVPAGIGFLLVALVGISPILWMQWHRPFNIFSLIVLSLKPGELTETQRRMLRCFKTPVAKVVAVIVAILAFLILWQLNQWLPFAPVLKVPGGWLGGLVLAAVAFLLSNLFLQVPASVLMVLLTPEPQIAAANPYPVAQIPADFTLIGLQVKQILPPIALATPVMPTPAEGAPVAAPQNTTLEPVESAVEPEVELEAPELKVAELETAELETAELETAELRATEPEVPELEVAEEAAELEVTKLKVPEPDVPEPEVPQSELVESKATEPEVPEAQLTESEPAAPEAVRSETTANVLDSEPVRPEPVPQPSWTNVQNGKVDHREAVKETASSLQEPPLFTTAEKPPQPPIVTPNVADTVVTIKSPSEDAVPPVEDKPTESKSTEPKPTPPTSPSVSDTIVSIELPPPTEEK